MAVLNNGKGILNIMYGYLLQLPTANLILQLYNAQSMALVLHDGTGGLAAIHNLTRRSSTPTNKLTLAKVLLPGFGNQLAAAGVGVASDYLTGLASDLIFGDSELGRGIGTIFSQGVSSATDTLSNNILKGTSLTLGLGLNVGASVAGAGAGLAANYIGKGITAALGDSKLARGIGQGVATGLGSIGGQVLGNLISGASGGIGINPAQIVGTGLSAAFGPSKEYGGKYGNITLIADTAYDIISTGANLFGPIGMGVSGLMSLNKGLSNIFGSTDGMTKTDAILGSAFMPAPVKWLNVLGATKTGTFNNLSWQNSYKVNSFMGDAFGNLSEKFDKAREEAGKTYGTFSQNALRAALRNINFANYAWERMLALLNLNEYQNIRSLAMSSINNLRYAQDIQGGWSPIARGRYGMKILNNATNHNIGMRLLSGAALIDNKQMILCNVPD